MFFRMKKHRLTGLSSDKENSKTVTLQVASEKVPLDPGTQGKLKEKECKTVAECVG